MEQLLAQPLEIYYKMDHKHRGLCLIFNHETFCDRNVMPRRGTRVDRERLIDTFTALKFDVRVFDDASERQIRRILKYGEKKNIKMVRATLFIADFNFHSS